MWTPTRSVWSLTHLVGRPQQLMDAHVIAVGRHHGVVEAHATLWAHTARCGRV